MNLPRTRFAHRQHHRVWAAARPRPRAHVPAVRRRVWAAALLAVAVLGLAACSGGDGGGSAVSATTAAPAAPRPSSPARLTIVAPRNGQTVKEGAELRLGLAGAKIVNQTTTRIQGDEGHIHLLVDGKLVNMNYGLRQRLPELAPGQHVLQAEFVAADHAPFDPRILTQAAFTVAG
jgi:hypothetical protein